MEECYNFVNNHTRIFKFDSYTEHMIYEFDIFSGLCAYKLQKRIDPQLELSDLERETIQSCTSPVPVSFRLFTFLHIIRGEKEGRIRK